MARDELLAEIPTVLRSELYAVAALAGAAVVVIGAVLPLPSIATTIAGAQTAIAFGLNPVMAALLGMLTGIGGGMARDVLLAEIPTVLRSELYAVAALAGAAVVVIGAALQLPSAPSRRRRTRATNHAGAYVKRSQG